MIMAKTHGIARKRDSVQLPFESRSIWPNSTPRSGSFDTWLSDPAPVRVSVLAFSSFSAVFCCFPLFSIFSDSGLNKRRFWPD